MPQREAIFPAGRHALYQAHRYSAAIRSGDLLFVSGQVGSREDGSPRGRYTPRAPLTGVGPLHEAAAELEINGETALARWPQPLPTRFFRANNRR